MNKIFSVCVSAATLLLITSQSMGAPAKKIALPFGMATRSAVQHKSTANKIIKKSAIVKKIRIEKPTHAAKSRHEKNPPQKNRRAERVPATRSVPVAANLPLTSQVPGAVVTFLAGNDVSSALLRLQAEPVSVKNAFLIREMQYVLALKKDSTTDKNPDHLLRAGVANHNVFLFLRAYDESGRKFANEATRYYQKALTALPSRREDEAQVLLAALEMATGHTGSAASRFKKIDVKSLEGSFTGATYLASYYAAANDTTLTVQALQRARELDNAHQIEKWIAISDDFFNIRTSNEFQAVLTDWRGHEKAAATATRNSAPVKHHKR